MLSNLKIGVRLGIGFAATLTLLIVIAFISVSRINTLNTDIQMMTEDRFPKTVQANNIIRAINVIARSLRNAYILPGAEQQKAIEAIGPQRKIITENIEKLEATVRSEQGKRLLAKIKEARVAYVAQQDKFLDLLKADKRAEIQSLLTGDLRTTQTAYIAAIDDLITFQREAMEKAGANAKQTAAETISLLQMLGVAAAILTILFGWFITRSVT